MGFDESLNFFPFTIQIPLIQFRTVSAQFPCSVWEKVLHSNMVCYSHSQTPSSVTLDDIDSPYSAGGRCFSHLAEHPVAQGVCCPGCTKKTYDLLLISSLVQPKVCVSHSLWLLFLILTVGTSMCLGVDPEKPAAANSAH